MRILDRLQYEMKKRGWEETDLMERAGFTKATMDSVFRKKNLPTISMLESTCKAFGITIGAFFSEGELPAGLNGEQVKLFDKWQELPKEQKELLIKFADSSK